LHDLLCKEVVASEHLFADDTPVPVLEPGRGRTKTGRLWVYARDQRGWGGSAPPAAVYLFALDRKAERPAAYLERFKGVFTSMDMPASSAWRRCHSGGLLGARAAKVL
jgi:transposase